VPGGDRIVVASECLFFLLDVTHHANAADHRLEGADGGPLVQGKDVDGLDGLSLAVAESLRHRHPRAEVADGGFHRDPFQGNGSVGLGAHEP